MKLPTIGHRVASKDEAGNYVQHPAMFPTRSAAEMFAASLPPFTYPVVVGIEPRAPRTTLIAPEIRKELIAYRDQHIPPNEFLMAVLENNLKEAFGRADDWNMETLFDIVGFCYNDLPAVSWGRSDKVLAWLAPSENT